MKRYLMITLLITSVIIGVGCQESGSPVADPNLEKGQEESLAKGNQLEDSGSPAEPDTREKSNDPMKVEEEEIGIYPGMIAPDLILNDRDNNEIKLEDYAGKIVFLNFWATTCPYCVDEMPDLEAFYQEHKDDSDFALLGVNMTKTWEKQSKDKLIEWIDEHEITFPNIFDEEGVEAQRWAAHSLPVTYIINTDGRSLGALMGRTDLTTLESVLKDVRILNE